MKRRSIRARSNHMRHAKLTWLTYARQRKGKSPYVTRPNRFRHSK